MLAFLFAEERGRRPKNEADVRLAGREHLPYSIYLAGIGAVG